MWALVLIFGLCGPLVGETFKGTLIDAKCQGKNPAKHTRQCLTECAGSGIGIILTDGTFYRFDAAGERRALSVLEDSRKEKDLRIKVEGRIDGDLLRVDRLAFE